MQDSKLAYGKLAPTTIGSLVKSEELLANSIHQVVPKNFEEIAQFIEFEEYWRETERHMKNLIKSFQIPSSYLTE